jgi:ribA/ribD-fused uncharacterized protein
MSPPRSVADLIALTASGQRPKYVFFWGHQPAPDGSVTKSCFSQWWVAPFTGEDGHTYPTAEHYMMAGKARLFGDTAMHEKILQAAHPKQAKELGRKVKGFDEAKWVAHRFDLVVAGNLAKFAQHPELKAFLLGTGQRVIVEASPVDRIWGIGLKGDDARAEKPQEWRGLNLLGFALMEVRDRLLVS